MDYICPQLYYSLDNPALTFEDSLTAWSNLDINKSVKLYVGLAGYKANSDADEGTWVYSNNILADEYKIAVNKEKSAELCSTHTPHLKTKTQVRRLLILQRL